MQSTTAGSVSTATIRISPSQRGHSRGSTSKILRSSLFDAEGRFVQEVRLQCEGDAFEDAIYILVDRLYVVTDSLSATLNAIGTGGDEELEEELSR